MSSALLVIYLNKPRPNLNKRFIPSFDEVSICDFGKLKTKKYLMLQCVKQSFYARNKRIWNMGLGTITIRALQ